jgi:hypothetical protein
LYSKTLHVKARQDNRDEKRAKAGAEKAKKKAGIMGRKEVSEKGTWKLEKEKMRCVTLLYRIISPNAQDEEG